jgi:uncharacterized protein YjbI with pentapeptide repeats
VDETSAEFSAVVAGLVDAAPAERLAAVESVFASAVADPDARQPVTDAVCAWLRSPVGADEAGARRAVLRLLSSHLRAWDGVFVDLSGATLFDADFSRCRLDNPDFADTRFHGTTRFDHAVVDHEAAFYRAVFHDDASFVGARFTGNAEFGRARFRGRADFTGAVFDGMAWFGRGAHTWWDDDERWDTVEEIVPAPWDEPNEDDPDWPVAVLIEDYQDFEEGGVGALFAGEVSFRDARFVGPAWFYYARFGATAAFTGAHFAGRVHIDQPTVDLTGARWGGGTDDGVSVWPLGWAVEPAGAAGGAVVPDESVAPYARQLADRDPATRSEGVRILDRLGDHRPELRQGIVVTLCAMLREPIPFDLRTTDRTPEQTALLRTRWEAQHVLATRLRPGPGQWKDMCVYFCGATLVDLDLSGCEAEYVDFVGAQFHGNDPVRRQPLRPDGVHAGRSVRPGRLPRRRRVRRRPTGARGRSRHHPLSRP